MELLMYQMSQVCLLFSSPASTSLPPDSALFRFLCPLPPPLCPVGTSFIWLPVAGSSKGLSPNVMLALGKSMGFPEGLTQRCHWETLFFQVVWPSSLLLARKLQESIHPFRSNWWCRPPGHLPLSAAQVGQTACPLTGVIRHPRERLFFLIDSAMEGGKA